MGPSGVSCAKRRVTKLRLNCRLALPEALNPPIRNHPISTGEVTSFTGGLAITKPLFLSSILPCRRRHWHPTPVLLPGKSHGWRSLVGYSPWGCQESDTTEQLHFHFSLSCIGEGNGNPLQCSCLESPRDGGAWWAAVYGVAQSQARLKRLSSSSILPCSCYQQ